MINFFKYIFKKIVAVGLLLSLLFPFVQNLIHVFSHHNHAIECDNNRTVHLHEIKAECDYNQFYTSPRLLESTTTFYIKNEITIITTVISLYKKPYLKQYYLKNIISRGPPLV